MAKAKRTTADKLKGPRELSSPIAYLVVATVRLSLDAEGRSVVQPVGDLLLYATSVEKRRKEPGIPGRSIIRHDDVEFQEWQADEFDNYGPCAATMASTLRNLYEKWFEPEQWSALSDDLRASKSSGIVVSLAPHSHDPFGVLHDPAAAKTLWERKWRDDWDKTGLDSVKTVLHQWISHGTRIDQMHVGDAVLTTGGKSWPDRVMRAYQGKDRRPGSDQEERLPSVPTSHSGEVNTAEQAFALLETRFPDLDSLESRAVRILRAEFADLRQGKAESSAQLTNLEKGATELSRIATMADRAFFREFDRIKDRTSRPELKALLVSFLRNQVGRDFGEIADPKKRLQRKKEFAIQVRDCAQFVHCKFRLLDSGEVGNLTFGRSGSSVAGQFKIYRKESGDKVWLLEASEFPKLGLVETN